MKKYYTLVLIAFASVTLSCNHFNKQEAFEENEAYDGPMQAYMQDFEKTKDPTTGTVPYDRLWAAMDYTKALKGTVTLDGVTGAWTERGPSFDSVGSSNGNGRGGAGLTAAYTAGRINGFIVDAADATGNTVFCGGACGGIWKCTNFKTTTAAPNWQPMDDYMNNMSIVSFAQDPTNPNTMYVATGEPWFNVDAVRGKGVFKSTDHGTTWTALANTSTYTRSFKIICDAAGNVYYATATAGILRSNNGGTSWTNITPTGYSTCTDIEISSTGTLHASFGFNSNAGYAYTTIPATATTTDWQFGNNLRSSGTASSRMELAVTGNYVYSAFVDGSGNVDSIYKSNDGGANFKKMNTTIGNITNTQGWYDLTLAVNPTNPAQVIMAGLDAYKSIDSGKTFTKFTFWSTAGSNYVHADHHGLLWKNNDVIMATDGGMFLSTTNGTLCKGRNQNLRLKQFYACEIHPTSTDYILAGAQDNGVHQLTKPGLNYSTEVTGGDGCFVAIDQNEPQYQYGSYVYNNYRRSTDGGASWSSFFFSPTFTVGSFVNPYVYDDAQNIILAASGTNNFFRWNDPQTAADVTTAVTKTVALSKLNGMVTTIAVSPYTVGRAYFGSSSGRIVKVDSTAKTTGTATYPIVQLTTPTAAGSVSCIAIGTTEQYLLAIYSNYGINNVYYSSNGGTSWTAIDGNLPDMPVRWAVFHPTQNNKIVIATEAGIYTTINVNGASTQWLPSQGFPLVRTDMIKLRKSDNTLVAATHGRGVWTGNILDILPLKKINLTGNVTRENTVNLSWNMIDATTNATYNLEYSIDGVNFTSIAKTNNNIHSYQHQLTTEKGYYRIVGTEPNSKPIYSNVIAIKLNKNNKGLQINIAPNPVTNNGKISINSTNSGAYTWQIINAKGIVVDNGKGNISVGLVENVNFSPAKLSSGMYVVKVAQNGQTKSTSFVKQ